MGLRDMYSAGDIIEYEGGGRDYLVSIEGEEGLWVNACNPSWVERGLRGFCDECHPFFAVPLGLHQVRAHRPRHPNRAVGHRLHRDAALHGDALLITR